MEIVKLSNETINFFLFCETIMEQHSTFQAKIASKVSFQFNNLHERRFCWQKDTVGTEKTQRDTFVLRKKMQFEFRYAVKLFDSV